MTAVPQATWADTLAELARYAADRDLPAPLTVVFSGDDPAHLAVSVSGTCHAEWVAEFGDGARAERLVGSTFHNSIGELPSGATITLTCLADDLLPSAVGS